MQDTSPQNFQHLRDQWALKACPTESDIRHQQSMDQQANPHNDNYANKRPRRSQSEIVSDLAYKYADEVLGAQYGMFYELWLTKSGYVTKWNFLRKGN